MAALTAARNTLTRQIYGTITVQLKANAVVYKGGLVATDATGYGVDAATATGLTTQGIALASVDNTGGSSGALTVDCLLTEAYLDNSGGDPVVIADFGKSVYITDDHTVSATNAGGNTQSIAGFCTGLDANGVWVYVGVI